MGPKEKNIEWVGNSKRALLGLGIEVVKELGRDLQKVQWGGIPKSYKNLGDYSEIKLIMPDSSYRLMMVVKFAEAIYILHAFNKKSNEGSKVPIRDQNIIDTNYKDALQRHKDYTKGQ